MKIDELKKAIRGLVREEVRAALSEEVRRAVSEEVSKAMGKVLVEMVKEIKSNNSLSLPNTDTRRDYIAEETDPITPNAPVLKTNNPRLNNVLAETARRFKPLPRTAEMSSGLADLMGGFDKVGANENFGVEEPATKMDFLKQMVGQTPVSTQPSVLDGGVEVPDILKKVFKKDFRAVMKKIDEQKKNGVGGYINPSSLMG